jgi:hypothetical protein
VLRSKALGQLLTIHAATHPTTKEIERTIASPVGILNPFLLEKQDQKQTKSNQCQE